MSNRLSDLCGLGDLLTYFAGNLSIRKRVSTGSTPPAPKEIVLPILVKVLHPLLTYHELGELKCVVGVTGAMLQQGFFACLREVEDYLVHLGRVSNCVYVEASMLIFVVVCTVQTLLYAPNLQEPKIYENCCAGKLFPNTSMCLQYRP
jgi:hypothetical protein